MFIWDRIYAAVPRKRPDIKYMPSVRRPASPSSESPNRSRRAPGDRAVPQEREWRQQQPQTGGEKDNTTAHKRNRSWQYRQPSMRSKSSSPIPPAAPAYRVPTGSLREAALQAYTTPRSRRTPRSRVISSGLPKEPPRSALERQYVVLFPAGQVPRAAERRLMNHFLSSLFLAR